MEKETLEYWEKEVWQIIRYNASIVKIHIEFSGCFGWPSYEVRLIVNTKVKYYSGQNLWKRYRDIHKYLVNYQKEKILK